ncbi:MAG: minichromosome maintenance protein MCM [Candidatus Altiarchaeota archaeon]|nr:minichromosome maintenance protein MCM [Candidatus Altiarchaeota archaeon]
MKKRIENFLDLKTEDLNKLAERYPEKKSFLVDWQELEKYDSEIAEKLIEEPDEIINLFEAALHERNLPVLDPGPSGTPEFHARFWNMPKEKPHSLMVRYIDSTTIARFTSTEGVVNRISDVLPKAYLTRFRCNGCKQITEVKQERSDRLRSQIAQPLRCQDCGKMDFTFMPEESGWVDFQVLEIQEPLEFIKGGEQARKIKVWVEDDLTDKVTAGDKVVITGTIRLQPPQKKGSVYYKFIEANNVEPVEKEFEDIEITKKEEKEIRKLAQDPRIYEKIVESIAPAIYGYNEVKAAIALQMFGGRQGKILPDGGKVRADIHLLLIGDPGVAKSRLLKYVDDIAPKSIYVSGKGTTGAGLTASAEKDELAEGAWTLKAGALVLAGGGIACIDEFDKMDKEDRGAMHEAMEQQTISVAKAGIVARFKSNTAILAASNPKFSRFDNYKPLGEQFDIPPTLLSRFDLIFPIQDILDMEQDRKIAEHMLKMHKVGAELKELEPTIETELFRKYIAYARKSVNPILTDEAADKIRDYYVGLRAGSKETVRATARQLEALVRLAEASAKIRLSDKVTIDDAERVINLTNFVLKEIAYDKTTGEIDIDRIVTSHPKSTRDRIRTVEDVIKEAIGNSTDGSASLDDILRGTSEKNLQRHEVEKIITELKTKGIIYEPRHNKFMFTEGA